jgi:hypothetical protein
MSFSAKLNGVDTVTAEARGALVRLVFGHMAAQVVAVAARFGMADLIGDGERTAAELAEKCGAHTESMGRLLRAMAALELLTESRPGCFTLTPVGALLRTDRPDSVHAFTRMFTDRAIVAAWGRLDSAVRTGQQVFDEEFGTDFFSHLDSQPELSALFNASMSQGTRLTAAQLPAAYDFSRFATLVDVGGGDGTLIAAILREHPGLRGILFDTPAGLAQADATLRHAAVHERCEIRPGDFFESVPDGGDLYLLKSVVHDWDDQQATTILGHIREIIPDHGRLLIVEPILPDTVDATIPAIMYLSDLNMLVNLGGRERTRTDFNHLCRQAGFTPTTITPLPPPAAFSLIEANPA